MADQISEAIDALDRQGVLGPGKPDTAPPPPAPTVEQYTPSPTLIEQTRPLAEPDYSRAIDAMDADQTSSLKQSMYVASEKDPEKQAKVLALSRKMSLPPRIVEANYDEIALKEQRVGLDYGDIVKKTPSLAKWLEDPHKMALSKDDLPAMGDVEAQFHEQSNLSKLSYLLSYGIDSFLSQASQTPALVGDVGYAIKNQFKAPGAPDERTPDALRHNPITKFFDTRAEQFKTVELGMDFDEALKKGKLGGWLVSQALANAPNTLAMLGTGMLAGEAPALIGMGVLSAANKNADVQNNPNVSQPVATANALLTGTIEAATEKIHFGWFSKAANSISKRFGKQTVVEMFKDFGKTLLGAFGTEAGEEALSSIGQDLTDYFTGVDKTLTIGGILKKAGVSGLVGGVSGVGVTAPAALGAGVARSQMIAQANINKEFMKNLGTANQETKLKGRSRDLNNEYIASLANGTAVKDVLISPDALEAYFQKSGESGTKVLQEAELLKAYDHAKETGTDLKIPLQKFVDSFVDTNHYAGLQNDIKFNENQKSINELKAEEIASKSEMKAAAKQASTEGAVLPEAVQREKELQQVKQEFSDSAHTKGTTADQAAKLGILQSQHIGALSDQVGISPLELHKRFSPQVQSFDVLPEELQSQALLQQVGPRVAQTQFEQPAHVAITVADQEAAVTKSKKDLKEEIIAKFRAKTFVNEQTGWAIEIPKEGIKKTVSSNVSSPTLTAAMTHLDQLISSAVYDQVASDSDPNVKNVHYLYAPIQIGNDTHMVRLQVRELTSGDNKNKLYLEKVSEKKRPASNIQGVQLPGSGLAIGGPPVMNIADFQAFLKEERQSDPLFQVSGEEPKGFFSSIKNLIGLLPGMDRSTFLHEMGHSWLNNVSILYKELKGKQDAELTEKQKKFLENSEAILEYLKVDSFDNVKREQHELFAKTFEKYLATGEAPVSASDKLKEAFTAFKVWLTHVYRGLVHSDIQITPEVRRFMDRLLTADDAVASAENQMELLPLFGDPKFMGMSEDKTKAYIKASNEAAEESRSILEKKVMADYQREEAKWYKEQLASVKVDIENEVNNQTVYKAISTLQKGTLPDGTPVTGGMDLRLDKATLKQAFGDDIVSKLPRGVSVKDGMHPDQAAILLGYESGDELIKAMSSATDRVTEINRMAQEKMSELHPDIIKDGRTQEEAINAIHNEKQAKLYKMELEHLASEHMPVLKEVIRRIARPVPNLKEVRRQANQIIGTIPIGELNPNIYLRAGSKAGRAAADLLVKGDINAAFEAKRKQLLNHELYRSAQVASDRVKDMADLVDKINQPDEHLAKTRNMDLVNSARAILGIYGLGDGKGSPLEPLKSMQTYDNDTYITMSHMIYGVIENKPENNAMTYGDFIDMADAVEAVWELSRSQRMMEIDGKKIEIQDSMDKMSSRINEIAPGTQIPMGAQASPSDTEKNTLSLYGATAFLVMVEHWVDALDGFNPKNPDKNNPRHFRSRLWNPISEAAEAFRVRLHKETKSLTDIFNEYKDIFTQTRISAPELTEGGFTFKNKSELIGALLHTGNESNLEKLLLGRGWATVDQDGEMDRAKWDAFMARMYREGTVTARDYEMLQKAWDFNEALKPEAWKAHKEIYGFYPGEITAKEIITPFGVYRGGYVPAVADPLLSEHAAIRQDKESLDNAPTTTMFPNTGRGFTKSRVEGFHQPLSIDPNLMTAHLDKVLRFVYLQAPTNAAGRMLLNKEFRANIAKINPVAAREILVPWLQRTAKQQVVTPSQGKGGRALDKFFGTARRNSGVQMMSLNVINSIQNVAGYWLASSKVSPRFLRDSVFEYVTDSKNMTADIVSRSNIMSDRLGDGTHELMNEMQYVLVNATTLQKIRDKATKWGRVLQSATQNAIDSTVWRGGYNQAIENGFNEKEAVRQADSAVRLTQGSNAAQDISKLTTGPAFVRMFTQYANWFNMVQNLRASEMTKIYREVGLKKGTPRMLMLQAMIFMPVALVSATIAKMLSGKPWDEDDDGSYLNDLLGTMFGGLFQQEMAMIPVAGPILNLVANKHNDKPYDDKLSLSPVASSVESAAGTYDDLLKFIDGKSVGIKLIKDSLTLAGLATGLPLAPIAKPITYLHDVSTGKAQPSNAVDFTRGLVTGQPGKSQ